MKTLIVGLVLVAAVAGISLFTPIFQGAQAVDIQFGMDEEYLPNASFTDDYRCFILDPELEENVFVTEFLVHPGQDELVHHAVLFVVDGSFRAQLDSLDQNDEGPGWTCFGGPGDGGGGGLERALGTWAPGLDNSRYPEGTAKLLRAGALVIMQVHYSLNGNSVAPDQTMVELQTSDDGSLAPVLGYMVAAPIEVQCAGEYPEDSSDPCNRDHALNNVQNPSTNGNFHQQCGTNAGFYINRDVELGDNQVMQCTRRVQISGTAIGSFGHMHLRGTSLHVEINPGTTEARTLLDIPRWNFNNQEQYWLDEPFELVQGDTLQLTCTFDNSGPIPGPDGNPLEPRYIVWGEGTTDEMCLVLVNWIR
jgi:hypothetical protein